MPTPDIDYKLYSLDNNLDSYQWLELEEILYAPIFGLAIDFSNVKLIQLT